METPESLIKQLRVLDLSVALTKLENYVLSRTSKTSDRPEDRPKMVGWFGIRYGKQLLFTESPEQAEEWEKRGIEITGALVKAGVQTHAGRE